MLLSSLSRSIQMTLEIFVLAGNRLPEGCIIPGEHSHTSKLTSATVSCYAAINVGT